MSEDKKSFTLESIQAEREKLQKAAKDRFEKQELERKQMGDSLLKFLRLISEEDIKRFVSIYDASSKNSSLCMIMVSYYINEDINFIDELQIKDFIEINTKNDLKDYFQKIASVNSNIIDSNFFINIIYNYIDSLRENKITSGSLYNKSVDTIRFMLDRELNDYFDYKVLKDSFKGNLEVYLDNPILKSNNIIKKLDYHEYVNRCIDNEEGFIDVDEQEISKITIATNLPFTGNKKIYDDKKRLIKSFRIIEGKYTGYSTVYYYDHYKHLNNSYKKTTPSSEQIYTSESKIFSSYQKDHENTDEKKEIFGEITMYDVEGNIIETYAKRNSLIVNTENSKIKKITSPLFELSENIQSLPIINQFQYFLINLKDGDEYFNYDYSGGFGDINLIHNGQYNWIDPENITSARSDLHYNYTCYYHVAVAHYEINDEEDILIGFTLFSKEFFDNHKNSNQNDDTDQKYKELITFSENYSENKEIVNCFVKMNEIYGEDKGGDIIKYGSFPIFSNKISILKAGSYYCPNGWYSFSTDKDNNFIDIQLQKEHELTNDEKAHLEEVSKEYMEQP